MWRIYFLVSDFASLTTRNVLAGSGGEIFKQLNIIFLGANSPATAGCAPQFA
jgi:hypothetical protein